MIKPKFIIISVCVGFLLSFFVGLFSGVSFGVVVLRALIFAVLFGALGFGLRIVFLRFLLDSSDMETGVDVATSSHQGSVVDISIGDEPLVEDENGPDFYVRKDLPGSDQRNAEKSSVSATGGSHPSEEGKTFSQETTQEQFRPISLGTPVEQERATGNNSNGGVVSTAPKGSDDALPDIGDLSMASASDEISSSSEGMDLAIGNGMETSQGRGSIDASSDSQTIAQAIRTVLARDS
ncbi:MAG: hypothetical protein J6K76_07470 [Spirochaetaceae bacterium]|nr:hypothetical protein [Spirochaetaceae bacterium]